VTEGWRKLHNEELHNLYSSPNIIGLFRWGWRGWVGNVAHMGEMRKLHATLVGKCMGKRPLGRPTR